MTEKKFYYRGKYFETFDEMKEWTHIWRTNNPTGDDISTLLSEHKEILNINLKIYSERFTNYDLQCALEKAFMLVLQDTVYKND
ncbi:MAG TPA: hypothetical protein VJ599_00900 [Nitrososphaeraceae archaeon]|nr:hypothetical protein [Nitrososphaeraceae archaeon]